MNTVTSIAMNITIKSACTIGLTRIITPGMTMRIATTINITMNNDENHRQYRDYSKLKRGDQDNYWKWRHEHGDDNH